MAGGFGRSSLGTGARIGGGFSVVLEPSTGPVLLSSSPPSESPSLGPSSSCTTFAMTHYTGVVVVSAPSHSLPHRPFRPASSFCAPPHPLSLIVYHYPHRESLSGGAYPPVPIRGPLVRRSSRRGAPTRLSPALVAVVSSNPRSFHFFCTFFCSRLGRSTTLVGTTHFPSLQANAGRGGSERPVRPLHVS